MANIEIDPVTGAPIVVSTDAPASTDPVEAALIEAAKDTSAQSGGQSFIASDVKVAPTEGFAPATPVTAIKPTPPVAPPIPLVEVVAAEKVASASSPVSILDRLKAELPLILKRYGMDSQQQQKAYNDIISLIQ